MTAVLICIPLLSALIGWLTARLPFLLLFHPGKPWKFGPITIVGAYYAKESALKASLASLINKEMLYSGNLEAELSNPHNLDKLRPEIEEHIDIFLKVKLKEAMPMIGMLIGDRTTSQLKGIFMQEMEILFPSVMKSYVKHLKEDQSLERLIKEKMDAFTPEKAAELFYAQTRNERKSLEKFGLLIGLLVGSIQLLIIIFSIR